MGEKNHIHNGREIAIVRTRFPLTPNPEDTIYLQIEGRKLMHKSQKCCQNILQRLHCRKDSGLGFSSNQSYLDTGMGAVL
jgi:hypothetical protein